MKLKKMAKIVESLKFDRLYPNYSSRPKFVGKISVYTVFGPLLTPSPLCTYYVHSPFDGMRAYNCLSVLTILLETP